MSELSELKELVATQGQMIKVLLEKLEERVPVQIPDSTAQRLAVLRPPGAPERVYRGCVSQMTGWTFDAVVDQGERVIRFLGYSHPGKEKHIAQGGIVPDGMPMRDKDGQMSQSYKEWICTFYPKDNLLFIGKKFNPLACGLQAGAKPVELETEKAA